MRTMAISVLAACGFLTSAVAQSPQQPAAVPVSVVTAEKQPITKALDFVGRVDAVERVEVKARVTGYLQDVLFKEGDLIKQGTPLYSIEKDQFEAAVEQAQGSLERSKGAKVLTEVQLQRAEELLAKAAGTAVARDQAQAQDQAAKGTVMMDEASLRTAQINLGYTSIASPINGKVGKTNVTKGNVVGPDSGPLTMIVSQDPMYVTFPVSQREFLRAEEAAHGVDITGIKASLRLSDGSAYKHAGKINFVDVKVDRATDTVLMRATFPNPDGELIDGQLVRVGLEGGEPVEKIVIPQAALITDQQGIYVFVVSDGKAEVRRIKTAGSSGSGTIVDQGLKVGDQVVVEGFQNLRPDAPVRATPAPSMPGRS